MGFNDSYSGVRGQILLINPLPSVRQAYSSVSQEEKQRLMSWTHTAGDSSGSAAMAIRSNNKFTPSAGTRKFDRSYCPHDFRSQEKSPDKFNGGRQDKKRSGIGRGRPLCTHCGELGHWVQTGYTLHGYPTGHPRAKNNSGPKYFNNNNRPAVNHVSEVPSKEDNNPIVGISEAQLQQLLSLLDNKNGGSSSQANAVTKPAKKVFTSRDVKFHETVFPYASLQPYSTNSGPTTNSGLIPLMAHSIPYSYDSLSDDNSSTFKHASFFSDSTTCFYLPSSAGFSKFLVTTASLTSYFLSCTRSRPSTRSSSSPSFQPPRQSSGQAARLRLLHRFLQPIILLAAWSNQRYEVSTGRFCFVSPIYTCPPFFCCSDQWSHGTKFLLRGRHSS
ncbi:hypothetical protein LWI28_009691 [Acer negundo]|uniref:Uncharacterized protein n=1 Tax=Acer negundo TaxID=4023 RepID=A0AAD5JH70_ACENE|nr:hypothetical protein LWI28_009691 [Acer negundo]